MFILEIMVLFQQVSSDGSVLKVVDQKLEGSFFDSIINLVICHMISVNVSLSINQDCNGQFKCSLMWYFAYSSNSNKIEHFICNLLMQRTRKENLHYKT